MSHPRTIAPPAPQPPAAGPGTKRHRPAIRRLPPVVTALGLFAAVRLVGVLAVAVAASATDRSLFRLLGRSWDSVWYLGIAAHGYGHRTTHYRPGVIFSDLAFFPLYPGLVRAVESVLPVSWGAAALLVSWTAAAAAACGIFVLGSRLYGRPVGLVLVLLWGVMPHSVVLSMAYTEPLLTAFAVWALYAALSGRWVWAGSLAALAGLSRPNGFAVAAAVLAAAAQELWRARREGRKVVHSLWTGALLAPAGWCAYVTWVGLRRNDLPGGYFKVQSDWGSRFDFGVGAFQFVGVLLTRTSRFVFPIALVTVLVAVLLFALLLAERVPLPLAVYTGVLLVVALGGSGFFESKPRFLLPAFPLLIPPALALARTARARPGHAIVVITFLTGLSLSYGVFLIAFGRAPL
ncbi:mannosyltransferase family protein [Streptomyces uncialis]|uniref:mannosyltransferase family protein n=1 Tax=Streptomyces uncialis TaxID=1048205 RepID=UPI0033EF6486